LAQSATPDNGLRPSAKRPKCAIRMTALSGAAAAEMPGGLVIG
jgi:hypothetical protein